ncbi:hypothetical protein M405DRAFT_916640 [Rhizopogon salebrosus TDB-379]|nr:hypothetical protein M405DRAFT_916640 [Rhizopogon salebrosus TDB-379]
MGHPAFGWSFAGQRVPERKSIFRLYGHVPAFGSIFLLSQRVTACASSTIYCPAICTTFPHRSSALPQAFSRPSASERRRSQRPHALRGLRLPFRTVVRRDTRFVSSPPPPCRCNTGIVHNYVRPSLLDVMLDVLELSAAVPVHSLSTATVQFLYNSPPQSGTVTVDPSRDNDPGVPNLNSTKMCEKMAVSRPWPRFRVINGNPNNKIKDQNIVTGLRFEDENVKGISPLSYGEVARS